VSSMARWLLLSRRSTDRRTGCWVAQQDSEQGRRLPGWLPAAAVGERRGFRRQRLGRVAVVGPLQQNNERGYERVRTREGKIRDQEPAALAHGVDGESGNTAAVLQTPARNRGSLAAPRVRWFEGKRQGGVGEERASSRRLLGLSGSGGEGEVATGVVPGRSGGVVGDEADKRVPHGREKKGRGCCGGLAFAGPVRPLGLGPVGQPKPPFFSLKRFFFNFCF
jgi:hypothetical protein